jgi:hypothetical protein
MSFPKQVLEAKRYLEQEDKINFETICLLTEPKAQEGTENCANKNSTYLADYEAMWNTLKKHTAESDREDIYWVVWFVNLVTEAMCLPPYHYKNKQERQELIDSLEDLTKKLKRLYSTHQLDEHLVYNHDAVLTGFFIYEGLPELEQKQVDACVYNRCPNRECHHNHCQFEECETKPCPEGGGGHQKIAFTEVLELFRKRTIENIDGVSKEGKAGENARYTRFIRILADHNQLHYEKPLYEVIKVALFAVYEVDRSISTISGLLTRSKKVADQQS